MAATTITLNSVSRTWVSEDLPATNRIYFIPASFTTTEATTWVTAGTWGEVVRSTYPCWQSRRWQDESVRARDANVPEWLRLPEGL